MSAPLSYPRLLTRPPALPHVHSKAVSHACRSWRLGPLHVKVAQFEGGDTGRSLSDQLTAMGVTVLGRQVPTPTRTCTTLLGPAEQGHTRVVTEIVEPGGKVRGVLN